ncbi:hypothetical protein [Catenibacterium sp.]|uniref:hypothetical protein n=1 Tax=Catenibacterium sp. TaxID=2049022 RepID=UPI00399B6229
MRQVFTAIPDRNSFGEVCLCNTCLQQVLNLTITSTKLKSTHLSTKQLDEAIQAIDQQLDKGYFSQDIKEGIHTYFDKYYRQRQSIDYSCVIAPVVADLCTTPVALSAPPNSFQNNSQS